MKFHKIKEAVKDLASRELNLKKIIRYQIDDNYRLSIFTDENLKDENVGDKLYIIELQNSQQEVVDSTACNYNDFDSLADEVESMCCTHITRKPCYE